MERIIALLLLMIAVTKGQDWVPNGSYEYLFSTQTSTWDHANTSCQERGASLTSITSEEENEFILGQIQQLNNTWIGLTIPESCGLSACDAQNVDNAVCFSLSRELTWRESECCECRSRWRWTESGVEEMTYTNWGPGEPTGGNTCGRIGVNQQWTDIDCDIEHRYICKRRVEGTSDTGPTQPSTVAVTSDPVTASKNKSNDDDNSGMLVGIGVGVAALVIIGLVIIGVLVFLRRKRQTKGTCKPSERVYYNDAPYKADDNHNNTADGQENGYYNVGAVTPNEQTNYDDGTINYAQIDIVPAKPKPTGPKPTHLNAAQPDVVDVKYAEVDFTSNQPGGSSDGFYDSGSLAYASIDTLEKQRELSYHPSGDGYAEAGDTSSHATSSVSPSTGSKPPAAAASNALDLQAMYAQPKKAKKKKGKVVVDHIAAPDNKAVLYAVPDKKK